MATTATDHDYHEAPPRYYLHAGETDDFDVATDYYRQLYQVYHPEVLARSADETANTAVPDDRTAGRAVRDVWANTPAAGKAITSAAPDASMQDWKPVGVPPEADPILPVSNKPDQGLAPIGWERERGMFRREVAPRSSETSEPENAPLTPVSATTDETLIPDQSTTVDAEDVAMRMDSMNAALRAMDYNISLLLDLFVKFIDEINCKVDHNNENINRKIADLTVKILTTRDELVHRLAGRQHGRF